MIIESVHLIDSKIDEIDRLISAQMDEIIHHKDFQKLEASWRGLHYLVRQTASSSFHDNAGVIIKIISVRKNELIKDFEKTICFDQSIFYEIIYTEIYNTYCNDPFGVLIGDYEFRNDPKDIDLLQRISEVAAAAHAPFISAVSAQFFGWESFSDIADARDISKLISRYRLNNRWQEFRKLENSRYVGLVFPRVLMREVYGTTKPTKNFCFEENVEGLDQKKYLWGNGTYAVGTCVTAAFFSDGLAADIQGVRGGMIRNLPTRPCATEYGKVVIRTSSEVVIRDYAASAHEGFILIIQDEGFDYAYIWATPSVHRPSKYTDDQAYRLDRMTSQLQYNLVMSRFAHYLMVIYRDNQDGSMTRSDVSNLLNTWISQYVGMSFDSISDEEKAICPLGDARIDVQNDPDETDDFRAIVSIRPRFQLEEPPVSLRIDVKLRSRLGVRD